jgi:RNA polymerase sigma factor (sigma-70 family)
MTDYELVCKAKTDQTYMYNLYKKYEHLIQGNYRTFLQINPSTDFEFEDYMSEAYLILNKTVSSFNPNKIQDPEKWKFTSFFIEGLLWNNLATYKKSNEKYCKKKKNNEDREKYRQVKNTIYKSLYAFIDRLHYKDTTIEAVENALQIENFIAILSPQEKTIINNYFIPGERNRIPSMREIGIRMGMSKQRISVIVRKMKIKWQSLEN